MCGMAFLHLCYIIASSWNCICSVKRELFVLVQNSLTCNWEKNRKTFFDFLSSGLGINVSLFRLGQFEEVESELGSPEAGVEIGTG